MKTRYLKSLLFSAGLLTGLTSNAAETRRAAAPAPYPERLQWWTDARFGMFIHWRPVSLKGTEIGWSRGAQVPVAEYDQRYQQFNPTNFNAGQWVNPAREAGMGYLLFLTKHHDGFCLWDTKTTHRKVTGSPLGRDVLDDHTAAGPHMKDARSQSYRLAEFTYPILPKHEGGARWFYSPPKHDQPGLPAEKIYADHLDAVKCGNLFSLEVGPDYAGRLREIDVQTLRQVGEMIRKARPTSPRTKP